MRTITLLLFIANVSLFSWYSWYASHSEPAAAKTATTQTYTGDLRKLSELDARERTALKRAGVESRLSEGEGEDTIGAATASSEVEVAAAEATAKSGSSTVSVESAEGAPVNGLPIGFCYRFEGFDSGAANRFGASFTALGGKEVARADEEGGRVNYWVMLPPYPSREKANEATEILMRNKIKDFYIVRGGEDQNAVSLGVFSTREAAERRSKQIASVKGRLRKAKIYEIKLPGQEYWQSWRFDRGEDARVDLEQQFDALGTKWLMIECPGG